MAKFPAMLQPIAAPVRSISEQIFAAGIREALAAGDTAKAERLRALWRSYVADREPF